MFGKKKKCNTCEEKERIIRLLTNKADMLSESNDKLLCILNEIPPEIKLPLIRKYNLLCSKDFEELEEWFNKQRSRQHEAIPTQNNPSK